MSQLISVLKTTWWLLAREFFILRKDLLNSLIDCLIIPVTFIIIGGYILPTLGMPLDYGSFMVVGAMLMMTWGTCSWIGAGPLVSDLEGDRAITYELVLPLPSSMVLIKTALGFAIHAIILNIVAIPIGKVLLMDKFDLSHFSLIKFVPMYVSSAIMFGLFAVMIALWVENSFRFGRFWCRIGAQLTFFGGTQFSWLTMYKAWPLLGWIGLLNPLVYAFEGCRASVLGAEGNLNYWLCLAMVWAWILVFYYVGYYFLKKRLDCV
jgi:ABC-type polysaccharide/polyol phosphate export permease